MVHETGQIRDFLRASTEETIQLWEGGEGRGTHGSLRCACPSAASGSIAVGGIGTSCLPEYEGREWKL